MCIRDRDDKVRQAVKKQKIVVDAFPRSPAALAISSLANKALTWPIPKTPSGHLEFFVERLLHRNEFSEDPFGE